MTWPCAAQVDSFAEIIFLMMNTLTNKEVGKSVMNMWGLWKQIMVYGALQTRYAWLQAKEREPLFNPNLQRADPICKR